MLLNPINIAQSLQNSLHRADDCCFRLGGEEFGNNANVDALGLGPEFRDPNNPLSKGIIYFRYDSSLCINVYGDDDVTTSGDIATI